ADAEQMFSPEMAQAVPAAQLRQVWESLPAQAGAAQGRGDPTTDTIGEMTMVAVPLHYANVALQAQVVVQADGTIVGFRIQPAPPPASAEPEADATFIEREFEVAGL